MIAFCSGAVAAVNVELTVASSVFVRNKINPLAPAAAVLTGAFLPACFVLSLSCLGGVNAGLPSPLRASVTHPCQLDLNWFRFSSCSGERRWRNPLPGRQVRPLLFALRREQRGTHAGMRGLHASVCASSLLCHLMRFAPALLALTLWRLCLDQGGAVAIQPNSVVAPTIMDSEFYNNTGTSAHCVHAALLAPLAGRWSLLVVFARRPLYSFSLIASCARRQAAWVAPSSSSASST